VDMLSLRHLLEIKMSIRYRSMEFKEEEHSENYKVGCHPHMDCVYLKSSDTNSYIQKRNSAL
jgi:hypothetical protein